jgi:hypothetical protein
MLPLRLLVYLVLVVSSSAFACVCHEVATPADWYAIHHGQPTFVGIVVSVDRVTDVVRQGGGKPLLDASGKTISTTVRKVSFA